MFALSFASISTATLLLLHHTPLVASTAYCYDPDLRPEIPIPTHPDDCSHLTARLTGTFAGRSPCHFQRGSSDPASRTWQVPFKDLFSGHDPNARYGCGFVLDLRIAYMAADVSYDEVVQAASNIVRTCVNHRLGPRAGWANVGYQRKLTAKIMGMPPVIAQGVNVMETEEDGWETI